MNSNSSDADVLARSAAEPSAFEILYRRHNVRVRRYIARRTGPEASEDLTSEVFVRAFAMRQRYRAELESALPWLLGVANHIVANHRRTERRRLKALQRLAGAATPPVEYEDRHLSAELIHDLRRLPDGDRDTLLLVVWGELSYAEAATALGVPIGTVSSRIARARRALTSTSDASEPGRPAELCEVSNA